jgi:hypothetical protein
MTYSPLNPGDDRAHVRHHKGVQEGLEWDCASAEEGKGKGRGAGGGGVRVVEERVVIGGILLKGDGSKEKRRKRMTAGETEGKQERGKEERGRIVVVDGDVSGKVGKKVRQARSCLRRK